MAGAGLTAAWKPEAWAEKLKTDAAELPAKDGPNENYARELMELHTLGVDGGYTEKDVQETARILTGWAFRRRTGDFRFFGFRHDYWAKEVMGVRFPAGRGVSEGRRLLDMLARHPSTARLIAGKLARRFISDNPPESVVENIADTFSRTGGDIRTTLRTLLLSDEFRAAGDQKLKRPFEYVVSTLRAVGPEVSQRGYRSLFDTLRRLAHLPLTWPAPNGFPDVAGCWISTAALLNRWNFALATPGGGEGAALDLDGFFGLHPALAPVKGLYDRGELALIHAAGNPSDSHSHFSSQDYMERGRDGQSADSSGWLGRHLAGFDSGNASPFRAVVIGPAVQKSMAGETPVFGVEDIQSFNLNIERADPERIRQTMLELYAEAENPLDLTTHQAFSAMDILGDLDAPPGDETDYPASPFGSSLRTLAVLIKAGLGVEVASVDSGDWDHHNNLAAELGGRVTDLGAGLAAFVDDLGAEMQRVTVVVMTEFGRRAYENASAGTDHGHGGVMLTLGAGVNGGEVYADWPGLSDGALYGAGDLAVTTDFRLVLGELLTRRFGATNLDTVFQDYQMPAFRGIYK